MDVRSPLFQNIACILMGVMFLNPIVSTAAELTVDAAAGANTNLGSAQNGVPVVNIATPNGSGLSHNKFTDYNVGQQGLILNNGTAAFNETQLGGVILGNSNLNGRAANLILNEVTGGNRSQLKGYTEVAGQGAHVVVANPHGITCDGCGFINTPRATLTTGTPVIDNGRLDHYDVNGGDINVEGAGLNASNISQFDLITRSAKLNAQLQAQQLNIIAGRNDVDATTLAATAKADDGNTKPLLAIDSSALGGMYAGAIRLVGTEAGVGVKLAGDMAASGGDIQIDASGKLTVARVAGAANVQATAQHIELTDTVYAGKNATLTAAQIDVANTLVSGANMSLNGGTLNNNGTVNAGGNLTTDLQQLNNSGKKMLAVGNATVKATNLNNSGGTLASNKALTVTVADTLNNNAGSLQASTTLKTAATHVNNTDGTLGANSIDLDLTGALTNTNGLVESTTTLKVNASSLTNNGGKLRALGSSGTSEFLLGGQFNNDSGLVEIGNSQLNLTSASLSNAGGTVRHLGNQFALALADVGNAGGSFITNGELSLNLANWTNTSVLQAQKISLNVGSFTQTATGKLRSVESITATGDTWHNDGSIETDGALNLTLTGAYTGNGSLLSQGDLTVNTASVDTGANAEWKAGGKADFTVGGNLINRGKISAAQTLIARANTLNNYGTLGAATTLRVEAGSLLNDSGLMFSGTDMALRTNTFTNRLATVYSLGSLSIAASDAGDAATLVENRSGTLESGGDLSIHATTLNNIRDVLTTTQSKYSARIVELPCSRYYGASDCDDKRNGVWQTTEYDRLSVNPNSTAASYITAGGKLDVRGNALTNQSSAISAGSDLVVRVNTLQNTGIETGEIHTTRVFISERTRDIDSWQDEAEAFTATYWNQPNANSANLTAALNHFIGRTERENATFRVITPIPSGDLSYSAIIQTAGTVDIVAGAGFDSSVVRPTYAYVAGGNTADTNASGSNIATNISINPQLPPDTTQQPVNPNLTLPQGQNGLFHVTTDTSHPYLVETNPAFATLRGFISSDYLLGVIGYNADQTQRRLGDGLYEQRLVQQAIVARTGKRFLDGLASDEAQFKYLMDNAIASKTALNLVPGIALSAEQVAALTHDIVWMQEQEVAGQKVLVPVLYLAQATDRVAPTGALIQGRDVTLISGSNLTNNGTLRASNNLSVSANTINNSGLMQANERLSLLATDSIRNARAGLITGKDVSAIALAGDIVNERSVTTHESSKKGFERREDFVDNAAGIEASDGLTLSAGRDLVNQGGNLKAGGNADLSAGRDLLITSQSETDVANNKDLKGFSNRSQTTHYGSSVQVGGDLKAEAGRDLAVVASTVKASGNIDLSAAEDLTIASAADESTRDSYHKSGGKKVTAKDSVVRQQAAVIEAGGDLDIDAGNNLLVVASQLKAGDEAFLYAGNQLALLSAEDSDYHLFDMKNKGGWGAKETKKDETTSVRNVGTSITTGGDLSLVSEGDQRYQKASLQSGGDLTLDSGGAITFEAVKDLEQESHEESKSDWAWNSTKGKGTTDETLRQSSMVAKGDVVIRAVDGLNIDIKQINKQTVSQTIDTMVAADPSLAWIKEAEKRGDVDWHRVKEVHDSFKYQSSGLGAGAQLIIAIVMAAFVGPAAMTAIGGGGIVAAGGAAIATSAATKASVSVINNRGNLGQVAKDVTSKESLKDYVVAGVAAGLTTGLYDKMLNTKTDGLTNKINVDLSNVDGVVRFAGNQVLQNTTTTALNQALGRDVDYGDALKGALLSTLNAAAFNAVGDFAKDQKWAEGSPQKIALHAMVGGMLSEAAGGDFKTGALAAGANEALVAQLDLLVKKDESLLLMASQLVGVAAAATVDGDLQQGATIAKDATNYNYLLHRANAEKSIKKAQDKCRIDPLCPPAGQSIDQAKVLQALDALASKDEAAVRKLDPESLRFAAYMLRSDEDLHYEIFIPETGVETSLNISKWLVEIFYPGVGGKAKVATAAGEVSKEVAEALEKKFADDLAENIDVVETADWAKLTGQLTEAAKKKGNFGIGSGTREQADVMGKAWVGDGYKVASDGKTLVSLDGLRQYRPPTYKPYQQGTQANFEQRFPGQQTKKWQSNAHLDITD